MLKRLVDSGIFLLNGGKLTPPNVWESTFTQPLTTNAGEFKLSALQGKFIGFYSSARRCSACQAFTQTLREIRDANAADFEVVFISRDDSAEEMAAYMRETQMPWPAVPFASPDNGMLREKLGIGGIPRLVIVSPRGRLISSVGRADVIKYGGKAPQYWRTKAGPKG